jgi:hypothetical protein
MPARVSACLGLVRTCFLETGIFSQTLRGALSKSGKPYGARKELHRGSAPPEAENGGRRSATPGFASPVRTGLAGARPSIGAKVCSTPLPLVLASCFSLSGFRFRVWIGMSLHYQNAHQPRANRMAKKAKNIRLHALRMPNQKRFSARSAKRITIGKHASAYRGEL